MSSLMLCVVMWYHEHKRLSKLGVVIQFGQRRTFESKTNCTFSEQQKNDSNYSGAYLFLSRLIEEKLSSIITKYPKFDLSLL